VYGRQSGDWPETVFWEIGPPWLPSVYQRIRRYVSETQRHSPEARREAVGALIELLERIGAEFHLREIRGRHPARSGSLLSRR